MNLAQIRHFLALAETLNFTRAAEACHVTQSALTKSVRKLEAELGGRLLLRERARSQLTELGAAMVPLLRGAAEAAEAVQAGARQFRRRERARLRIGLGPWVPPDALAPLIRALSPRFPDLEVVVRQGGAARLGEWLLEGTVDVVLTTQAERMPARADRWPLFGEAVVALVPPGHPLADAGPLSPDRLADAVLVARTGMGDEDEGADGGLDGGVDGGPDRGADRGVDDPSPACGLGLRARHAGATEEHVWMLVRAGHAVALSTARRTAPADLVRRPLDPPRALPVHVGALSGRPRDRAVDAFLRLARARHWDEAPDAVAT